jgi:hypothetical protein
MTIPEGLARTLNPPINSLKVAEADSIQSGIALT